MARGSDIGGRVTDGADSCVRPSQIAGLFESAGVDVGAPLQPVAERKEIEVPKQVARFEFDPSDGGKIASGHAENRFARA